MQSMVRKTGLLVLATLLFCGCSAQRDITPRGNLESGGVVDRRPCIANFSVEGSYGSGHAAKSFEDYPNSSKSTVFAHIISKLTSIGYAIDSSDKEAGLIGASCRVNTGKEMMTSLFASITQREPNGVRVDLALMTGGLATFRVEDIQKEFCSLLEGVPQIEKMETVETRIREETIVGKKLPVSEKPMIVEKPVTSALQAPQPISLMSLVVKKKANLREKATIKSKIIGKMNKGEKLEFLDRSGNWFRVKSASGMTGWIYNTLVRRLK